MIAAPDGARVGIYRSRGRWFWACTCGAVSAGSRRLTDAEYGRWRHANRTLKHSEVAR